MIPPDIAIRLRMQAEPGLGPITPTPEISVDFTNLEPGQRFQAQIQQPLAENTYRAIVNGREITLSLPETVKAGDVLELLVVDRTSRMLVAQRPAIPPTTVAGEADAVSQLSATAQLIGKLLPPSGQQAPPAPLNQGAPLLALPLPSPGDMAAILMPRLAQAATQSGLFYEAHQAQWLAGKHSTEALLQEPQAKANPHPPTMAANVPPAATNAPEVAAPPIGSTVGEIAKQEIATTMPAEIRPLVQQQLDAVATQRVAWQGEIWQGQTLDWQIARDAPERPSSQNRDTEKWNTSLALTTPRLGRIQALLTIAGNTITIRLETGSPESGPKLRQHLPALTASMAASGITVTSVQVRDGDA